MSRNLSKRVELLVPVEDAPAKRRLMHIMETYFTDTARGRILRADGSWHAIHGAGKKPSRSQEIFAKEAAKRVRQRNQAPDVLVPHMPKS